MAGKIIQTVPKGIDPEVVAHKLERFCDGVTVSQIKDDVGLPVVVVEGIPSNQKIFEAQAEIRHRISREHEGYASSKRLPW